MTNHRLHFIKRVFDLHVADRLNFKGFTLVYLRGGQSDFELELTINKDQNEPYELGNGYGHIAFCVDDLEAEHTRFAVAGLSPRNVVEFAPGGKGKSTETGISPIR